MTKMLAASRPHVATSATSSGMSVPMSPNAPASSCLSKRMRGVAETMAVIMSENGSFRKAHEANGRARLSGRAFVPA